MLPFADFLKRYNTKNVVPTLEARQKMIELYHNKRIDLLSFELTLTNLADICLHKSIKHSKLYPFTEIDKDLLEKKQEAVVGGPSLVFTHKDVVD